MADISLSAAGVYAIRNLANGKVYVGSAICFRARFQRHRTYLRRGNHHSLKLQRAWSKYGELAFAFEPLEAVESAAELLAREQHWIESLRAFSANGYNMTPLAGSHLGAVRGPEARENIRRGQIGRKHPPEVLAKISAISRARGSPSAETRAKQSASQRGSKRSDAARASMAAAQQRFVAEGGKRKPATAETRAKLSAAGMGRSHTPESIERQRIAKLGKSRPPLTDEWKAKISAGMMGRVMTDETKAKLSRAARTSPAFADARKRLAEKQSIAVLIDGALYSSYTAAAIALGCSHTLIGKWVKRGKAAKA